MLYCSVETCNGTPSRKTMKFSKPTKAILKLFVRYARCDRKFTDGVNIVRLSFNLFSNFLPVLGPNIYSLLRKRKIAINYAFFISLHDRDIKFYAFSKRSQH